MSRAIMIALMLAACATGGQTSENTKSDGSVVQNDSTSELPKDASVTPIDAHNVTPDAFVPKDAPPPPPPPDAGSSALFCTADSQCTNSGECCIDFGMPQGFCGPGTVVFGECIPQ